MGHLSMDYTCMKWFSLEKKVWSLSKYLLGTPCLYYSFLLKYIIFFAIFNIVELSCSEEKKAWKFPFVVGYWQW